MFTRLLTFALIACLAGSALPTKSPVKSKADVDWTAAYRQALTLFNSPNPTTRTDSLALNGFLQVVHNLKKHRSQAHILTDCYEKIGVLKQTYGKHRDAISYYRQALGTAHTFRLPDSLQFKPLLYVGSAYYQLHSFDSSRYFFDRAESVYLKHPVVEEAQRLYNSFGVLFYEAGNYRQSINYFRKALQINQQRTNPDREQTYSYKSNIATALRHLEELDSAIAIYKSLLPMNIDRDELFVNLGMAYLGKNLSDSALYFFQRVRPSNPTKAILYENALGRAYVQKKDYPSALIHLTRSMNLARQEQGGVKIPRKSFNTGLTYKLLGDVEQGRGRYQQALGYYQRSIIQLDYGFNDASVRSNPAQFTEGFSRFLLFESLAAKAACFSKLYSSNRNSAHINDALNAYTSAFRLAEYIEKSFDSEEARLFIVQKVFPVYQQAVELMVQTYETTGDRSYLEEAFRFSEKSKAAVLYISLKEGESKISTGLPDSLLTRERNLKFNLSRLSLRIDNATSVAEAESIAAEIRDNELALSRLNDQFHNYPDYYRKKFNTDQIDLAYLRNQVLDGQTALLSFFQTRDELHTFVLTQRSIYHHRVKTGPVFKQVLGALRTSLRNAIAGENYQGSPYASFLYQKLIYPIRNDLAGFTSLIIIPHNDLTLLPFDVLEDERQTYLIEQFDITYQYAASFLQQDVTTFPDLEQMLSLAPFSSNLPAQQSSLTYLPASEQEISHLNGIRLLNADATKENFLRYSKSASVIHLATHAVANNDHPSRSYIAFYPSPAGSGHLYAHEIQYGMLSGAHLTFLSACETASGKLVHGEGVMSLSRAISYAGCPNLITSLWKAEDQATAAISVRFYQYLRQGKSIAHSLRRAKLDLLKDEQFAQFHSPPYWSHLVYIGIPGHTRQPQASWYWWLAGGLALTALGLWLGRWFFRKPGSPAQWADRAA